MNKALLICPKDNIEYLKPIHKQWSQHIILHMRQVYSGAVGYLAFPVDEYQRSHGEAADHCRRDYPSSSMNGASDLLTEMHLTLLRCLYYFAHEQRSNNQLSKFLPSAHWQRGRISSKVSSKRFSCSHPHHAWQVQESRSFAIVTIPACSPQNLQIQFESKIRNCGG